MSIDGERRLAAAVLLQALKDCQIKGLHTEAEDFLLSDRSLLWWNMIGFKRCPTTTIPPIPRYIIVPRLRR